MVSSWFLKIMELVEYRIAKIFIIVVDGCIVIIHTRLLRVILL